MTVDLDISLFWSGRGGGTPELWDKVAFDGVTMPGIARIEQVGIGRKTDIRSPPGSNGANYRDKGKEPSKFTVSIELRTPAQFARWQELAPMFDYRTEPAPPPRLPTARQQSQAEADREAAQKTEQQRRTEQAATTEQQAREWSGMHEFQRGGFDDNTDKSSGQPPRPRRQRRAMSITHPMVDLQGVHRVYVDKVTLKDPRSTKGLLRVEFECLEYRPLPQAGTPSVSGSPDGAVFTASQQTAIGGSSPSANATP